MNFLVIGVNHGLQEYDLGFLGMLSGLLKNQRKDELVAIAEEYRGKPAESPICQLATERGLNWYNVDMSDEEKKQAGISEDQQNRGPSGGIVTQEKEQEIMDYIEGNTAYRVPTDDIREQKWVEKLVSSEAGTTLVICGYVHFEPLVEKLRAKGCAVDTRVYLKTIPEIKLSAE
jgi:hypothetical protein